MSGLPDKDTLLVSEVAEYLRVSEQHVRDLVNEGELEAFRVGTALRIKRQSVIDIMNKDAI